MITDEVRTSIEELKRVWEPVLGASPAYTLDGTWPSLGVIDLITDSSRLRQNLSPFEEATIRGCAAYIGAIAHDCWEAMGAKPVLELAPDAGVVLRATSGPRIEPGEQVTAAVESELRELLRALPNPYPVLNGFSRLVSVGESVISSFAIGIVTGLSPVVNGAWSGIQPEDFTEESAKVVRQLALQCAANYATLYPDEPLGQVAELYLHDVVYPPMLMMEDWPVRRAVRGLWRFFSGYEISKQKMAEVSYNLAFSPDELLSHAGFVFHAALLDSEPTPAFRALAYSKGPFVALLRPALVDVRSYLGQGEDWLAARAEIRADDESVIALELALGFHPWLRLPAKKIATCAIDAELESLIRSAAVFDAKKALAIATKIAEDTPHDIALRLQHVYLLVINERLEQADSAIAALLGEPEAQSDAPVFNMAGLLSMVRGELEPAEAQLKRAIELCDSDPSFRGDVRNSLGWLLFCRSDANEALKLFNQALEDMPGLLVALLNKAGLLFRLGYESAAWLCLEILLRLAPCDRRVFAGLVLNRFQLSDTAVSDAAVEDDHRFEERKLA